MPVYGVCACWDTSVWPRSGLGKLCSPRFELRVSVEGSTDMTENIVGSSQFTRSFEEKVRATVAARLRAARKAKGYTQKDLATRVDTSQTYISDLEKCAVNPSMLMLIRLAEALEVELATLFEGVQNE